MRIGVFAGPPWCGFRKTEQLFSKSRTFWRRRFPGRCHPFWMMTSGCRFIPFRVVTMELAAFELPDVPVTSRRATDLIPAIIVPLIKAALAGRSRRGFVIGGAKLPLPWTDFAPTFSTRSDVECFGASQSLSGGFDVGKASLRRMRRKPGGHAYHPRIKRKRQHLDPTRFSVRCDQPPACSDFPGRFIVEADRNDERDKSKCFRLRA